MAFSKTSNYHFGTRQFIYYSASILCLFSLQSCATLENSSLESNTKSNYTVYIDAISEKLYSAKKFVLTSGSKEIPEDDLQFREFSNIVSKILSQKGFIRVSNLKLADHIVVLNYSVSGPNTTLQNRLMPVPKMMEPGRNTIMRDSSGNSIGSFETQPTPGGIEFKSVTEYDTKYIRNILITAFGFKKEKGGRKIAANSLKMLWRARVTSAGSSNDLRKLFPVMMLAAQPFISGNSGEQREIDFELNDDDPRVQNLSE